MAGAASVLPVRGARRRPCAPSAVRRRGGCSSPLRAVFSAVLVGRLIRFTIEAVLAVYFGRRVIAFLNSPIVEYFVYGLIVIAVILSALSLWKWLKKWPPDSNDSVNLRVGGARVH